MTQLDIKQEYFEWMYELVCNNRYSDYYSYRSLFVYLHNVEFKYSMSNDANRAEDGIDLRYRFAYETGHVSADSYLEGPPSVLEVIIALAIRCEDFMDDTAYGNRTAQWFWKMIGNLGIGGMCDSRFDEYYVEDVIDRFLNRDYEADGRGGLFIILNCDYDLRHVDIWTQLCWYLDSIY